MFNPNNIKSLYWRTMAIISRHFLIYVILLIAIVMTLIFGTCQIKSLKLFLYCKGSDENDTGEKIGISTGLFTLIGFLIIKLLIDKFTNWLDIVYSIIFIIISWFFIICVTGFLILKDNFELKYLKYFTIFLLVLFSLNFILANANWYKKLWNVNEDAIGIINIWK
jgi:hypothetical protein